MIPSLRSVLCAAFLSAGVLSASCTLLPNSVVRVALPPGDARAAADWTRIAAALPQTGTAVELVAPGSFPPPDLVWFDGDFDSPAYQEGALGANAQVEALGREAGLAPGWFAVGGDRIYPLAWSPWSWWSIRDGAEAPSPAPADTAALAQWEARRTGPAFGGTAEAAPRLTGIETHRVWLPWTTVKASPIRVSLTAEPSALVAARVKGLWWNQQGWNPHRVPELLAALWSKEVQAVWNQEPEWMSAASGMPSGVPVTEILLLP